MNVLRTPDERFAHLPDYAFQAHTTIRGAGHFLQEDKGHELAQVVVDFIARTQKGHDKT
jgi:haloalkane dehalogenase